jgi:hypothetical protein
MLHLCDSDLPSETKWANPVEVLCICCTEIVPEAHAKKLYWEKEKAQAGKL